jgi:hypothetical protein
LCTGSIINYPSRDLKPEYLVLTGEDLKSNLKVIDFGASVVFKKKEHMSEMFGTVKNYM